MPEIETPSRDGRLVAPSSRIQRAEFIVPYEFRDLAPKGHEAARIGGARIELVNDRGVTHLGSCYQQIPVRLMPPFHLDDEPAALLYLITLTAGLFDGDGHRVQLNARAGTNSVVTGQAATRVHPSVGGFSTQQWDVTVEDEACLVVLPGPTIPYRGARYYQRGRVEVAPGGRLIWGDLWLAGRYARGDLSEKFAFDRIVQDLEIRQGGRLVYRDRFRWDGPWTEDEARWFFGGGLAVGSLILVGPPTDPLPPPPPDVRQAAFPLESGATCLRWCGSPAAVTSSLVHAAFRAASTWTSGPDAPPWLLESTGLSPNHWFSTPRP